MSRALARDKNERALVNLARRCGRHVSYLNGAGIPDLLLVNPLAQELPIYIVRDEAQMLAVLARTDPLCLVEVKDGKNGLTDAQVNWWRLAGAL